MPDDDLKALREELRRQNDAREREMAELRRRLQPPDERRREQARETQRKLGLAHTLPTPLEKAAMRAREEERDAE